MKILNSTRFARLPVSFADITINFIMKNLKYI